jgi:hypothetical protein
MISKNGKQMGRPPVNGIPRPEPRPKQKSKPEVPPEIKKVEPELTIEENKAEGIEESPQIKVKGRPVGATTKQRTPKSSLGSRKSLTAVYCRTCMKERTSKDFYVAVDEFLDRNGYMSICRYCCNDIYNMYLLNEKDDGRATLRTCRTLNVRFDEQALQLAKRDVTNPDHKDFGSDCFFGIYKMKLKSVSRAGIKFGSEAIADLTFVEPPREVVENTLDIGPVMDDQEYYELAWGKNQTEEDYNFLEMEFAKWRKTTKCDTQSEEIFVREICHKQNEIRKARVEGKSVDVLVKSLQELMKNSALTPALQNAASSGKNAECFGMWIKDIEQLTPAEWYQDKLKYKDIDGIDEYNQKYITRPLQNFITGSRDFNVSDIEETMEDNDEIPGDLGV